MSSKNETTLGEEILSSITHGVGLVIVITGLCFLIFFNTNKINFWRMTGIGIFGFSVVLTYVISTLYHSLYFTKARNVFKRLDHASIFILIAGTYTPFILIVLKNNKGLLLLLFLWVMSILGIIYKVIFINKLKKLQVLPYLFLGWIGILIARPLINALSLPVIILLILGGCFYTFGTVFYAWRKLKFNHGIWHLFVLFGTVCHYIALLIT